MHWLDYLHARYQNDGLFFDHGFGDETILATPLVRNELPEPADVSPLRPSVNDRIIRFASPDRAFLPKESKYAQALVVMPADWDHTTPVCIQLPATGDEGFQARQKMVAEPLKELGIGSVILENPYYGVRRPHGQSKTYLRKVSELWSLGLAVVSETQALLEWLRHQGFQHLGVCGVSMGGAMMAHAVALTPYPLAACGCIAPHSATPVFLEGVLSHYVDWQAIGGEEGRERLGLQLDGSDIRNFPQPIRPDCAIWLAAKKDAYVDPDSSLLNAQAWPNSRLYWLNSGHVGTALFHRTQYIQAIEESFRILMSPVDTIQTWFP